MSAAKRVGIMNTKTRIALVSALLPTLAIGCLHLDGDNDSAGFDDECEKGGREGGAHEEGGADEGGEQPGRSICNEGDDDGGEGGDIGRDDGRGGDEGGADEGGAEGGEEGGEEGGDEGGRDDGGVCEPHVTDLIAGQHTDTGSVTVTNDDDEVMIAVDAAAPYLLAEVHIYVGTGEIPVNQANIPAPGQFPYVVEFPEPVASYDLAVELAELGVGCDDELNVAVHAVVVSFDDQGNEVFSETAWGFGDERFEASRWGWSFDYGVCCEEPGDEGRGCTLTQGYWSTHNSEAEVPALQDAWPIAEDTQMCGMGMLDILQAEPNGDAWMILAAQYIAAQLNIASGATTPGLIDAAMQSAGEYLAGCSISDADRDGALAVSQMLDAYNNGEVGPGHCE
jgi:hypothetical protein